MAAPQRQELSSRWTFFYKFAFPPLWLGLGGLGLAALSPAEADGLLLAIGALWIVTSVFFLWLGLAVKKVALDGDVLEISNYRETHRFPLRDVERVSGTILLNPELVSISFRRPTAFGTRVTFIPRQRSFRLFSQHPIVARLRSLTLQHEAPGLPPPLEGEPRRSRVLAVAGGALVLAVVVALIAGVVTSLLGSASPYRAAVERAVSHPALVAELGEPIRPGRLMSGRVHVADETGTADLAIPLSGPRGEATLRARAIRSEGEWTFRELHAVLADGRRLDLLADERPTAEPPGELL